MRSEDQIIEKLKWIKADHSDAERQALKGKGFASQETSAAINHAAGYCEALKWVLEESDEK